MINNEYALIDLMLCGMRLFFAVLLLLLTLAHFFRDAGRSIESEKRKRVERRDSLLLLTASTLAIISVLSWPILYLLLQSYVREWPGLMCIYGVTRIGEGSIGSSRFLPTLVTILEWVKPVLVFLCGLWFVLHLGNRAARSGSITHRVVLVMAAMAVVGLVDAGLELAYLTIPKKEVFPSGGCCTGQLVVGSGANRFIPKPLLGLDSGVVITAFYAANATLLLAFFMLSPRPRSTYPGRCLATLLTLTAAVTLFDAVFVVDVLAPKLLGIPDHHCPYDLVSASPRSVFASALLVTGGFCVAWALVAFSSGHSLHPNPVESGLIFRLCQIGGLCNLLSFVILWLAFSTQ